MTDEQKRVLNSTRLRLVREYHHLSSNENEFSKKVCESTPFSGMLYLAGPLVGSGVAISGLVSFGSGIVGLIASAMYGIGALEYAAEATPIELNKLASAIEKIFSLSSGSFKVALIGGGAVLGMKALDELVKRLASDFEAMNKLKKVREEKSKNEEFQKLVNELMNDVENEELEYAREYLQTADLSNNDAKTNFEIIKGVLQRSLELSKMKKNEANVTGVDSDSEEKENASDDIVLGGK